MQVVSNLINGEVLGLGELARGEECVFFEEVADFVVRFEEVGIADMGFGFAGGEFGQRVGGEGKALEKVRGFGKEGGSLEGVEVGGED